MLYLVCKDACINTSLLIIAVQDLIRFIYEVHWNINNYLHVWTSSNRQSYDISIVAQVDQTGSKSSNLLDLKNPFFRWAHFFWLKVGLDVDQVTLEAVDAAALIFTECDVLAGTQAPLQIPLLAHTTPPHLRTCGTQVLPTVWVRGWLYQVKTHVTIGGSNARTWSFVFPKTP